jgi:glycosyltransferase involved in cell wall biosynthesis
LAEHADITVLLFGTSLRDELTKTALAGLIEVPGVVTGPQRGPVMRRVHDLGEALLAKDPPEVTSYRNVRRTLRRRWPEFDGFDIVLIEHPGLAPLVALRGQERWLLTLHNVGSGTLDQQAETTTGRRRWIYHRQAEQARAFERRALDRYDLVFSVSDEDAAMLPGPTTVVPNGVDIDRFEPTPLPAEPRLALIGTLGYLPNVDGAMWFVNDVLPLVRAQVPDVTLDLVGRMPTQEVVDLAQQPGIEVHANVPDVREYFLRSRVCLVPLRVGTGTRLKALEGFAAYRPIVGTTVGLSGLDVVDGVQALVADEPQQLADRVVNALRDDALARDLVRNARRLVEERYAWKQIGRDFADAVLSAVRPPAR